MYFGNILNESNNIDKEFTSPEELFEYMKSNIKYKNFDKLMSAYEVYHTKKGSCHDQCEFENYIFNKLKISHDRLFLIEHNNDNNPGGRTHTLLYFIKNNKYYWFENSWGGNKGIFEYDSLSDMKKDIKSKMLSESNYKFIEFAKVKNVKVGMNLQEYVDACLK